MQQLEKVNKYIETVMKKISWKTIESYYAMNNIEWSFTNTEGENFKRIPTIPDLQADFLHVANLVIDKNITSMDYGNWILFWTNEQLAKDIGMPSAQMEALFVLTGGLVNDQESKSSEEISEEDLNEKMQLALEEEDYILAGQIKRRLDEINNKRDGSKSE